MRDDELMFYVKCWREMQSFLSEVVRDNSSVLAPGGISHSGPGGNRQFWPDENSQS